MGKFFHISQESEFVIYGASVVGAQAYELLKKNKLEVKCFLDKRAKEIKCLYDIPVYSLGDEALEDYDKKKYIVIVAVKNPFDHEEIVSMLREKGFFNIIYRPKVVLEGNKDCLLNEINQAYDDFFIGGNLTGYELMNLIDYETIEWKDKFLIKDLENGFFLAYVPVELIYTDMPKVNSYNNWRDLSFMSALTYLHLYDFFEGEDESIVETYLSFCQHSANKNKQIKITKSWQENVLRNRYAIYMQMNHLLALDNKFFERNATIVEWNKRGYFNVKGGKHRVSFLLHRNINFIPVIISYADYKIWINQCMLKQIQEFIHNNNMRSIKAPIEHPYFQYFESPEIQYRRVALKSVVKFLANTLYKKFGKVEFDRLFILDLLDDNGYFARNFVRMQAKVSVNSTETIFTKYINDLCNIKVEFVTNHPKYDFNIIFLETLSYDCQIDITELFINKSISFIFVFQNNEEMGKCLMNLSYRKYRSLGHAIVNSKRTQWGVFYYG